MLLTTVYQKQYDFYPFVICNSIAVAGTWYMTSLVFDRTMPSRMIEKHNWYVLQYIIGDGIFHLIPLLWAIYSLRNILINKININITKPIVQHCGLYTLFMNHLWVVACSHGFQPNDLYVKETPRVWNMIWISNAIFHIIPMSILMLIYDF
jgi:hypothetical protein